ncbi:MAG: GyrI-like domain-containing protein [Dehalococcoidales bacterium]|nr:GyrI-like domain-containing protein [Dehalococcoidales bacterium]
MPRQSKTDPRILEMPPQKVGVVTGKGAPDKVFPELMPALYGSVYTLRFDRKKRGLPVFKVSGLRARYPDAVTMPKDKWTMIVALPVPDDTDSLPQKVAGTEVRLETWDYGTVAQILHLGAYDRETASIERLHRFIEDSGFEIAGDHEEEYLTRPDAKVPKTIIRYVVRKKG